MATPPAPPFFSPWFFTPLAAPAPERGGSKADSFPFDDNRDEKQKEGILTIVSSGVVVSGKAAHREPDAQEEDEEEGCEHNLHTSALDFLSKLMGRAPEGRSEHPPERGHHSLVLEDSGAQFPLKVRFEHSHLPSFLDTGASFHAGDDMDSNHHVILDSGASMHATGNLPLLSGFTRAPGGTAAVYHARDGKDLSIVGVGIIAGDKFHLTHVHYVPGLGTRCTLVSVQQLAGCDYLVLFYGGSCYVKNRSNGSLVGRGRMHDEDGFYHLDFLSIPLVATDGAT